MTTATKTPQVILKAQADNGTITSTTTKGAPATGADSGWIDLGSADGGNLFLSIKNTGGAVGVGGTLVVQSSAYPDGTSAADRHILTGDTSAYNASTGAGLTTADLWIDPGVRAIRVFGYGNTMNTVTFGGVFSGVTRA